MPILSTKLKNAFPATYTVALRNININGNKRGCSGFVSFNGKTVYINTEPCGSLGLMFRTAKHDKDYTGGQNQWAKNIDTLVSGVVSLLK